MLKKHSKLVVLLVIATFLFSFVASAGAAVFTDVAGSGAEAAAIYKLNSLGIIDGYPDGTFGSDNTITRAEFAKVAVYTAGLQNVATGMKASPSTFKDVATSEWYNGWVNVAAAQGYVKGYSDGCFYPNKEVTQAEAITVLLRILGYNDNLAGNWPSDYIGKAANLGILDDVTFDAYGPATRGVVCTMAAETLDQNIVSYVASDNYFSETATGVAKTLLESKFKDWGNVVKERLVTYVSLDDNKIEFTLKNMADGTSITREVAKDCVFANGTFWGSAAFRFIDYVQNDDDEIAYVKIRDFEVIKGVDLSDITLKTAWTAAATPGEIKLEDKTYKLATNFTADNSDPVGAGVTTAGKPAGFLSTAGNVAAGTTLETHLKINWGLYADGGDLVLNDDGEVAFVRGYAYPSIRPAAGAGKTLIRSVGIVDQTVAKSGKITLVSLGQSIVLDPDETEGFYITKDGAPAAFADIKAGDLIYCVDKFDLSPTGTSADGGFIVDMKATVTGKLTAYEKAANDPGFSPIPNTAVKKITVGDKVYTLACGSLQAPGAPGTCWTSTALFSDDNGDTFAAADNTNVDSILGNEVTLYLNPIGEVAAIVSGAGESGKIYGVINSCGQTLANGAIQESIEVLKADGTMATYTWDDDSAINGGAEGSLNDADIAAPGLLIPGTFVEISLNGKGFIDEAKTDNNISNTTISPLLANITGDEDNKTAVVDGKTYDAEKVVVFDIDAFAAGDDAEIVKAVDFIDAADSTMIVGVDFTSLTYKVKDGVLKYVVIDSVGGIGGKGNLAMVAGTGTDSDGDYALFLQKDGTTKKVYLDTGANLAVKKALIYYDLSNDEADITAWAGVAGYDLTGNTLTVDTISGNIIKFVGGAQYSVDADTLYFDCSDDDPAAAEKADIASGDIVKVYKDATESAIGAVVLQ